MNLNYSKNSLLAGLCSVFLLGASPVMYAARGSAPLPAEMQQAKKITGTVTDAMGPVIGASVVIKGTSNGVAKRSRSLARTITRLLSKKTKKYWTKW